MVELVDTAVLGTVGESCAGSSPATYRDRIGRGCIAQ